MYGSRDKNEDKPRKKLRKVPEKQNSDTKSVYSRKRVFNESCNPLKKSTTVQETRKSVVESRKFGKSSKASTSGVLGKRDSPESKKLSEKKSPENSLKRVVEASPKLNKVVKVPQSKDSWKSLAEISRKSEDKGASRNRGDSRKSVVELCKLEKSSRELEGKSEVQESNKHSEKFVSGSAKRVAEESRTSNKLVNVSKSEDPSKRVAEELLKSAGKEASENRGDSRKRELDENLKLTEKLVKVTRSGDVRRREAEKPRRSQDLSISEDSCGRMTEEPRKLSENVNISSTCKSEDSRKGEPEESRKSAEKQVSVSKGDSRKRELHETQDSTEKLVKVWRTGEVRRREGQEKRKSEDISLPESSSKRVVDESRKSLDNANKSIPNKQSIGKSGDSRIPEVEERQKALEGVRTRAGESRKREQFNLITRSGEYQRCEVEETRRPEKPTSPSKSDLSRKRVNEEKKSLPKPKSSKTEDSNRQGEETPKKRCSENKSVHRLERVLDEQKVSPRKERSPKKSDQCNKSEKVILEQSGQDMGNIDSVETDKRIVHAAHQSSVIEAIPSTSRDMHKLDKSEELCLGTKIGRQKRELEQIFGVTDEGGTLRFAVKFKRENIVHLIPAKEANVEFPLAVIAFYQQHLYWKSQDDDDDDDEEQTEEN